MGHLSARRRHFLQLVAGASMATVAGCGSSSEEPTSGAGGTSSGDGEQSGDTGATETPPDIEPGTGQKLTADDGGEIDNFGGTLAAADGTVLVGAQGNTNANGEDAGAAYVFEHSGGEWTQEAKLLAADGSEGDDFGTAVALADGTAVVTATNDNEPNGHWSGSAYVFERSGGEWTQQTKLVAEDGDEGDYFGTDVAVSGDRILVGASQDEDPNGKKAGSAYVFERSNGEWSQQTKLVTEDGDGYERFGSAVALAGETALVGATNAGSGGAVYVFEHAGGKWTQQATLGAAYSNPNDSFGGDLAVDGDTLLVGSEGQEKPQERDTGAAHVYIRDDGEWNHQATLTVEDIGFNSFLGSSVAVVGDVALLGARGDTEPNGEAAGSAYLFGRAGDEWTQQAKLAAPDGDSYDAFGWAAGLTNETAFVGARKDEDPNGRQSGSAYAFEF